MDPSRLSARRHVVVFGAAARGHPGILSRVLDVGAARGVRARSGVTLLRARHPEAACPRVYERLGVAVADLDDDQLRSLRRREEVVAVIPNERCFVAAPQRTGGGPDEGDRPAPEPQPASPAGHSWCLEMVGVPAGRGPTGRGATVAVLDTGVDLGHPDLAARFRDGWRAESFVPGEGAQDGHGHGTHCVGIVGGPLSSSGGTRYGVAPGATVLVAKVLSDAGVGFTDWILDGIDWAAEQGARVISLSCISSRPAGQPCSVVYERVAENLLRARPGALLLAAAGNASERPWYTRPVDNPAACPSLVAVAAVHRARRIATFSGRRMDEIGEVNLSAPGVAVHSSWTGGGFRTSSGTSMAVPHVAGVAALYLEHEPDLSGSEIRRTLATRAQPLGDVCDFGNGLVQAGGGPASGATPASQ